MWRLRDTAWEAWRNLKAESLRAFLIVLIDSCLIAGVVWLELTAIDNAIQFSAQLDEAGRFVYEATSADGSPAIPAARCEALNANPAVVASAGIWPEKSVTLVKAPAEVIVERPATHAITRILAPFDDDGITPQAFMDPTFYRSLGLSPQAQTVIAGQGAVTVRPLPYTARIPDPGPWLWVVSPPTGVAQSCMVEVKPESAATATQWISAALSDGTNQLTTTRLLGEDRFAITPEQQFTGRPTEYAWAVAGFVAGALATSIMWWRRQESALYRSVGATWVQVVVALGLPYVALAAIAALAGASSGAAVFGALRLLTWNRAAEAVTQGTLALCIAWLVTIAGALAVANSNRAAAIKGG